MPAATDTPTKTPPVRSDQIDLLDESFHSLRDAQIASETAIAETVQAFTELVRTFLPSVFIEPARTLDVLFQFVEQGVALQRRFVQEVLGSLQLGVRDFAADQPYTERRLNGSRGMAQNNTQSNSLVRA